MAVNFSLGVELITSRGLSQVPIYRLCTDVDLADRLFDLTQAFRSKTEVTFLREVEREYYRTMNNAIAKMLPFSWTTCSIIRIPFCENGIGDPTTEP